MTYVGVPHQIYGEIEEVINVYSSTKFLIHQSTIFKNYRFDEVPTIT